MIARWSRLFWSEPKVVIRDDTIDTAIVRTKRDGDERTRTETQAKAGRVLRQQDDGCARSEEDRYTGGGRASFAGSS